MLDLFANIFGRADEHTSKLPPSLLKKVTERAIDGTDPRLRIVSGYAKTLKNPVIHAAGYIIDMIDSLPAPVLANRASLAADPALAALFYSSERMDQIIGRDPGMKEFRAGNPLAPGPVSALLVANRKEKHSFGYGEVNGQTLKDVPRTTLSFDQHLLVAVAADEAETRFMLKRRAFDQLLSVALMHLTERKEERDSLTGRKALLHSKLNIIQRGGSFSHHTGASDKSKLQESLEEIEKKLAQIGTSGDVLGDNLATIVEVLSKAESHLWLEDKPVCLDKLYVVHDKPTQSAPLIVFREMHNSEGQQVTLQMLSVPIQ